MKPVLNEGVHFSACLPLAWRETTADTALESTRYLTVLADFERSRDEEAQSQAELHAKLDLALLWLARVLTPELPSVCEAAIGLESLSWLSPQPLAAASRGTLSLCLSRELPYLLSLPARVEGCVAQGGVWLLTARLQLADELLRDSWERTVFRRHRRAIQQVRGGGG